MIIFYHPPPPSSSRLNQRLLVNTLSIRLFNGSENTFLITVPCISLRICQICMCSSSELITFCLFTWSRLLARHAAPRSRTHVHSAMGADKLNCEGKPAELNITRRRCNIKLWHKCWCRRVWERMRIYLEMKTGCIRLSRMFFFFYNRWPWNAGRHTC